MITVGPTELNDLVERARSAPRRRMNLNLHQQLDAAVNRLANAVEPDSYIRPHRHPRQWELLIALQGSFALVFFADDGTVLERQLLGGANGGKVIEYPANTWHSLIALETASVFVEIKEGPYQPTPPHDFLTGWPPENDAAVTRALGWLRTCRAGERFAL
jgi:cupin fold WbuC family metalloprotein